MAFFLASPVVVGMLNATGLQTQFNAGTAAVIEIFSGSVPADADATNAGTLLARLVCSKPVFTSVAASGNNALATFAAIASGAAVATGAATFFRILTQAGGSVLAQGAVGTSSAELILNTVAITTGSTVSITSATITLPEG